MIKSTILIICFLLGIANCQEYKFKQLSYNQVLDNQSVLSIDQDRKGQLWFAGGYNMFRYNTNNIKNITLNKSFNNWTSYIVKIKLDDNDNILLATQLGLHVYNISTDSLILNKSNNPIKSPINDIKIFNAKVFIASDAGVYSMIYNKETNLYSIEKHIHDKKVKTLEIIDESIYFGSENNIFKIDSKASEPKQITSLDISKDEITSIRKINNEIWLGTQNNGIFIFDQHKQINNINEKNSQLLSNNIRKIIPYNNKVLIGTLKGLTVIDNNKSIKNYSHSPENSESISQNSIYEIFIDKQGIIWFGTYFGGLNAIYPDLTPINSISNTLNSKYIINSNIVKTVLEHKSKLYIATEESGLQIIDKNNRNSHSLATTSNLIKDILIDENTLYIAQYKGGVSKYNLLTNTLENKFFYHEGLKKNNVNCLLYVDNSLILGTDYGLYEIKNNTEKVYNEFSGKGIYKIKKDQQNTIYVILERELWQKKVTETAFTKILSSEDNHTYENLFINNNQIYIGTKNQIYEYKNQKLSPLYSNKNVELGNFIKHNNTLWIGSNSGIIQYNLDNKKENTLTKEDGLTTNNTLNSTFYISDDNTMYVTSLKGISSFNPEKLLLNKSIPDVILDNLMVFDEEVKPIFNEQTNQHEFKLRYDQNFITIDFASSNFIKPKKNTYKYKLEGFDKEWKISDLPHAKYTNVPPGKYKLEIFASNNDGLWSEKPLTIDIIIHPPFWKTWWAYVCYVTLFIAIIYFIIKFIVERKILINSEKEFQKKMRFFTQISHEIRTPLTLITVPIEEIVSQANDNPKILSSAKRLQKNANKLLNIVNELLEFKKIDDGKEKMSLKPIQIKPYLEEYFYLFTDLAIQKNINYYIKQIIPNNQVKIDINQFDKVLFNLLSNAIKYSNTNGTVYLETVIQKEKYVINIVDNGIGISTNNQFKIFEEYYRDPKAQDIIGTGIGLALTKEIITLHNGSITCHTEIIDENNWTFFCISLPIPINNNDQDIQEEVETKILTSYKTNEKQHETILIVDDNDEISETLVNLFKENYHILTAHDGQEALDIAKNSLPDIIITDLMMPVMDGIELTEHLKQNTLTSHVPIIMLTADTTEKSKIEGLKYGANVYIEKPFNIAVLQFTVKNLLQIAAKNRSEFNIEINNTTNSIDKAFIEKIESIIEQNLLNINFGVDFLAKEIGVSQPILYKKLKSITDLSVNNFIKQYRFKRSIELLKTDKNISEVAYAVGFSDRKYFSKEFKKHFGQTPTEFLEKFKSTD